MGLQRIDIPYFEGVNTLVEHNLSKKVELDFAENARSLKIGSIEKRKGYTALGNDISATANYGLFYFKSSATSKYLYRAGKVAGVVSLYHLNNSDVWTALTGAGTNLASANLSSTVAEGCCFLANGSDENRYIGTDGTTVTAATTLATTNHLYNSPKARKINYYKNRLYVADHYLGGTRIKNGVAFSSRPLGLVSLVSGDFSSGVTSINVTDTKYIYASDTLDVIRGGTKITQLTITAKTENAITVSATGADIKSSDELWVKDTYNGTAPMVFRWANVASGTSVQRYDTFKLAGGDANPITMLTNIGDVMVVSNNDSFMTWNDSALTSYDTEIGCVSDYGYVKANNILFFVHYTGIYATNGGEPKLISSKVQDYFDGATRSGLEIAVAGKKGLNIFFYIGDVTLYNPDGSTNKTLSNVVLEYNIRQENWFVHTGIPVHKFERYVEATDANRIVFTNKNNFKVYEFLSGTTDDGAEIPFSIESSFITMNKQFDRISYPREFIIETEAGNTIKPFVSIDGGQKYELGSSAQKGCAIVPVTPKEPENQYARGRKIKLALKEFSKGSVKISRCSLIFSDTAEQEDQRP